jgi:hypothetical protein
MKVSYIIIPLTLIQVLNNISTHLHPHTRARAHTHTHTHTYIYIYMGETVKLEKFEQTAFLRYYSYMKYKIAMEQNMRFCNTKE